MTGEDDEFPPGENGSGGRPGPVSLPPPKPTLLQRLALALERARALRARIERARGRSRTLDATLQTIERDAEIGGGILAGALAYRLFVFVLPLAFFLVSSLGLVARALGTNPANVTETLGLSGIVGEEVAAAAEGDWNIWVALTSLFVLVSVTRSLLRAVVIVHALAWQRTAARAVVTGRSLRVFAVVVVGQIALVLVAAAVREPASTGGVLVLAVFVCSVAGLWLWVSLELPHSTARWVNLIPGAVLYAVGILAAQVFNFYILDNLLESKSSTYGALGAAGAILLGLFLTGRAIVGAAVLNATLHERHAGTPRTV